ncbi:MAG: hypothetical protein IPL63_16805 [Saprospiraceae bacterium]|nr:hypothetical protein [Saprospiraceae bacterium]
MKVLVAPELAEFGALASVFLGLVAYKIKFIILQLTMRPLTKNGVVTSLNSDSDELIRHLYHEAAKTQRYGNLT